MMKGITFDDVHSYRDLNLVLSKCDIPPATARTNFVDLPGGNGSVDLTEALGEVKYKDRGCKFVFTVFPYDDFEQKKKEVSNLLNGKKFKISIDKDPGYYWLGRCTVDEYASDGLRHEITVGATVGPYKLKNEITTTFVSAGENIAVMLHNSRKTVVPTIVTTAAATLVFNGTTIEIPEAGTYKYLDIELLCGANSITVTTTGSVKFMYQEGDL